MASSAIANLTEKMKNFEKLNFLGTVKRNNVMRYEVQQGHWFLYSHIRKRHATTCHLEPMYNESK